MVCVIPSPKPGRQVFMLRGTSILAPEFVPPTEPTAEEKQKALAERIYLSDGRIYYEFDQLLKEEQDRRRTKGDNVMTVVGKW